MTGNSVAHTHTHAHMLIHTHKRAAEIDKIAEQDASCERSVISHVVITEFVKRDIDCSSQICRLRVTRCLWLSSSDFCANFDLLTSQKIFFLAISALGN